MLITPINSNMPDIHFIYNDIKWQTSHRDTPEKMCNMFVAGLYSAIN